MPFNSTALRLIFTLLAIFSINCYSFSQYNINDKIPSDPELIINKLPNGLTYYIKRNTKYRGMAHLQLVVNAGSVLEDEDQLGLAHFLEHMNFNGSKHFHKQELKSFLESLGMKFGNDMNAFTSYNETSYYLDIPVWDEKIRNKAFNVLEDWSRYAYLEDAEIDKERNVVLEESRLHKNASNRI